jgi:chromosome segregation ATPase
VTQETTPEQYQAMLRQQAEKINSMQDRFDHLYDRSRVLESAFAEAKQVNAAYEKRHREMEAKLAEMQSALVEAQVRIVELENDQETRLDVSSDQSKRKESRAISNEESSGEAPPAD